MEQCFDMVRSTKSQEDKLRYLKKAFQLKYDINAVDDGDNNNTILHIAVHNGEEQIIQFLLDKNANTDKENNDQQTCLDLAELSGLPNKYSIMQRLKGNVYNKRGETGGIEGQLYESKLLTLIYLRGILKGQETKFKLRTSLEGIAALDDVVFRYKSAGMSREKLLFLQQKHREDQNKGIVMVDSLLKSSGDFSLVKYFESYLKIKDVYQSENIDYEFVLYTPALDNLKEEYKDYVEEDQFIVTNKNKGKIFKFKYNDGHVNEILNSIALSRAITVAQRLVELKDKFTTIMKDDCIKTHHMFLANYIFVLLPNLCESMESKPCESSESKPYIIGEFKTSFLTSENIILKSMRNEIFKRLKIDNTIQASVTKTNYLETDDEIEKNKSSLPTFMLPPNFGMADFSFKGNTEKTQCIQKLVQILRSGQTKESLQYRLVVEIDENKVGPNNILQNSDLSSTCLAGLLGKILVYDLETSNKTSNLLKLINKQNMSKRLQSIIEHVEKDTNIDLKRCRFDISIDCFTTFFFIPEKNYRKLLEDFLSKLTFYTNQAQEHKICEVFIKEFDEFPEVKRQEYDSKFQDKHNFVFPIVHEKIQNWWKEDGKVYDIDDTCPFYDEAVNVIMGSTLLDCLHFTVKENLNNTLMKFKSTSINQQDTQEFFNSSDKLLIISSDETLFSFVKLQQYIVLNNIERYRYIDIDLVSTSTLLCALKADIEKANVDVLVLITHKGDSKIIAQKINQIKQIFQEKIVIITNACALSDLKLIYSEASFIDRDEISYKDLDIDETILSNRFIMFQGNKMPVNRLLDHESLNLLPLKNLRDLIDHNIMLNINVNEETSKVDMDDWYSRRRLHRCISLQTKERSSNFFTCLNNNDASKIPFECKDIILQSNSSNDFLTFPSKNQGCNVHWFKSVDSLNVWEKSHGSIDELHPYVDRDKGGKLFEKHCNSICDITDRTVVICAEAGMGKSTLLDYLSVSIPKEHEVDHWVLKLDLSNRTIIEQISEWKDNTTHINLLEALKILYISLDIIILKDKKKSFCDDNIDLDIFKTIMEAMHVDDDKLVHLNKNKLKNYEKVDVFKLNLFNFFYNNRKVVLLFDSFDEIVYDYEEQLLKLFSTLKQSNIERLWVATRPLNALKRLEIILETFSYSLQPFTVDEQLSCLSKKLVPYVGLDKSFERGVINNLKFLYAFIRSQLVSSVPEFTSYPLHLEMITDVYKDIFKSDMVNLLRDKKKSSKEANAIVKITNMAYLYKEFVEKKFQIELKMKKDKHPKVRLNAKKLRKVFLENHKRVSIDYLFPKLVVKEMLSDQEVNEVKEFLQDLRSNEEQNGIVQVVFHQKYKFVHLSFAEYLAAVFICEKLNSQTWSYSSWYYLLNLLLVINKKGIYEFMDSILSAEDNKLIDNFETNWQRAPFYQLLAQDNIGDAIKGLMSRNCHNVVLILLKCLSTVVDKANLDTFINMLCKKRNQDCCIMCQAMESNSNKPVSFIIKIITKIDEKKLRNIFYCQDLPECHPFLLLVYKYQSPTDVTGELFHIVMKELVQQSVLLVDLFTLPHNGNDRFGSSLYTPAHVLFSLSNYSMSNYIEYLKTLDIHQIKKILNARDMTGKNPAIKVLFNTMEFDPYRKFLDELVSLLISAEDLMDLIIQMDSLTLQ